jgi:hypothetical protein
MKTKPVPKKPAVKKPVTTFDVILDVLKMENPRDLLQVMDATSRRLIEVTKIQYHETLLRCVEDYKNSATTKHGKKELTLLYDHIKKYKGGLSPEDWLHGCRELSNV